MSYFLQPGRPEQFAPEDNPIPSGWQAFGATAMRMMQDTNANFQRQWQVQGEKSTIAYDAAQRLGIEKLNSYYSEVDAGYDHLRKPPATVDDFMTMHGVNGTRLILDLARKEAETNPDAFKGIDLSEEGIEARVTERRKADDAEWDDTLSMYPGSRAGMELAGGVVGATADIRNLPFLFVGASAGSLWKVMAVEGAANAAAEAVTLPSQYKVARELGKPDPNPVAQVGLGFVGGAVIGGAIDGLTRAAVYLKGRGRVAATPTIPPAEAEIAVDVAEAAITRGDNPLDAVQRVLEAPTAAPPREPLIPPEITVTPLPDPLTGATGPLQTDTIAAIAEQGLRRADMEAALKASKPKEKPLRLIDFVRKRGGLWTGDPAIGDLRQFIEKMPGLYKKEKFRRSSGGNNFGGRSLDDLREAAAEEGFLPMDSTEADFIELLRRDATHKDVYSQKDQALASEWEAYNRAEMEFDRYADNPAQDYVDMRQSPEGFFADVNTGPDAIKLAFDDYLNNSAAKFQLDYPVYQEVLAELQARGGDADFLIERAAARYEAELDRKYGNAEGRAYDPGEPAQGSPEQVSGAAGQPQAGPADAGRSGSGGGERLDPASESTAAGEQGLIPGVAPVTTRAKLEAQQAKKMQGGAAPADVGLFDLGARNQMDMFSEPSSTQARPVLDQIASDMRDQIERDGDFMVDLGDGKGERKASTVLEDLDKGDAAADRLDLCGGTADVPF